MKQIHPQSYLRLLKKLAPHWKPVSQALLAMLAVAAVVSLIPVFVQRLLDSTPMQQEPALLQTALLAIAALFVLRAIAGFFSAFLLRKACARLEIDLHREFFDKLLALPADTYTQPQANHRIETLILTLRQIAQSATRSIAGLVQDGLIVAGLMAGLFYLNRELSVLLLFILPFMILTVSAARDHFDTPNPKITAQTRKLIDRLARSIAHYRLIKADSGQMCESKQLGKISESVAQAETRHALTQAAVISAGQIVTALILCALGYLLALQVTSGTLSPSVAGAVIAALLLLMPPLQRLANLPRQLACDQPLLDAFFSFTDQAPEQSTGTLSMPRAGGKLFFDRVRFGDEAEPLLDFTDLTIHPGDVVVFKGYTAAKKNTLIDLLLRLKSPAHGTILLNDLPLNNIRQDDLYANIALLPAEAALLDDNIAGNIAYGARRCSHEAEITTAARDSGASAFIRELPGGLQTRIGEEDTNLTAEQLQLLAIARALLKNAPILILDNVPEPQDPAAEILLPALARLMQNRTVLIFSQHIPPLKKIDRVIE